MGNILGKKLLYNCPQHIIYIVPNRKKGGLQIEFNKVCFFIVSFPYLFICILVWYTPNDHKSNSTRYVLRLFHVFGTKLKGLFHLPALLDFAFRTQDLKFLLNSTSHLQGVPQEIIPKQMKDLLFYNP